MTNNIFFYFSNRAVTVATNIAGASHTTHTKNYMEVRSARATRNSLVCLSEGMENSNIDDGRRADIVTNFHFDKAGKFEIK